MSKFKFKLNRKGVSYLLKGQEMVDVLDSYGKEIQLKAGSGYKSDTYIGKTRANASIKVGDRKSYRDNLKNNTLLKLIK